MADTLTRPGLVDRLATIAGARHVVTDPAALAPHLAEGRGLFHGTALCAVAPGTTAEVAAVIALCHAEGVPVTPQGGNTGQCGGAVPMAPGGVVLRTDRLNRIRAVDPLDGTITVEAGCILADIQRAAAEAGAHFPLSLGAEGSCRIGGNLSTNAGGLNVLRYGMARDLTLGLEVVLPDGRVWNGLRALRKDNTGYALRQLFLGAEGTLGVITAAVLKLFPPPRPLITAMVALPDPEAAIALLRRLRGAAGDGLTAFELLPRIALDLGFRHMPGGVEPFARPHPWQVLLEGAGPGVPDAVQAALAQDMAGGGLADAVIAQSGAQAAALWRLREIAAGGHQYQEGAIIKHDIAVPVGRIPDMIRLGTAAALDELPGTRVVAFGHAGDGNLHFNLVQPPGMAPDAFRALTGAMNRRIHDIVTGLGGSISAEHGIGLLKIDELERCRDPLELDLMRRIKAAFDPAGLMNPGKILRPA